MSRTHTRGHTSGLGIGPLFLLLVTLGTAAASATAASPSNPDDQAVGPASSTDEPTRAETQAATQRASQRELQTALMDVSCRDAENRPDSWLDRTHSYLNRRPC